MIKIMNEDNMELMARYPDNYFELAIVDPPYGIGESKKKRENTKSKKWNNPTKKIHNPKDWDLNTPTQAYFDELFRISKNQTIWGGNYFNLPPHKFYILWDKQIPSGLSFADCEMAWTSYDKAPRIFRYSAYRDKDGKVHPTQKPLMLFEYCIEVSQSKGDVLKVFDPFMGSGTTAIACKSLGLDWCGCELEADYVDIANKRLEKVQLSLF